MLFKRLTNDTEQPLWLVESFLRLGYCVTLAGKPECGKSNLASAVALAVAEGSPFADSRTTQGGVLWLSGTEPYDHRDSLRPIQSRLNKAPFYITYARPPIDTDEGIDDVAHWVEKTKARLVVVDPLSASHSGVYNWDAKQSLARFKRLCYRMNVTGLVLQTVATKENPLIEAAHFASACDMSILYSAREARTGRLITLRGIGRGEDANATWRLTSPDRFEYRRSNQQVTEPFHQRFMLDDQVFECIAKALQPLSAWNITERLNRNTNSIRNAIARLTAAGKIYCAHTADRARHFRAHPSADERNERTQNMPGTRR